MTVWLNGEARPLPAGATVGDLVRDLAGDGGRGVAVAVNGEVVARSAWGSHGLHESDRVEVLAAIGGG